MENKSVAIHQPNFMPWLGYFSKIKNADIFVFLDDIQFTKNSFTNRVKIASQGKEQWITIPVINSGLEKTIMKTEIFNPDFNFQKILKTIHLNYKRTPFFDQTYSLIEPVLKKRQTQISELNKELIVIISSELKIKTKFLSSSQLKLTSNNFNASERLVNICKILDCSIYMSGKGGFNYQDINLFEQNNLKIQPNDFKPLVYKQAHNGEFISGLSILDALFNIGFEKTYNHL